MKYLLKRVTCLVLSFIIVFSVNMSFAEENNVSDKERFEAIIDEFMEDAMEKYHVPGVTLSVVKDGKQYFKKGYGYSDLDNKISVNPDETLFRIGSVTKLFTATAIMQLYENGDIDLNEEVNKYLEDFNIEYYEGNPITIEHVLTHTGGFDERVINMIGNDINEELPDLGEYLKKNMPEAVREPGKIMQYSNHGMTLLGYIVENVSDKRIDKYIEEEIFNKLDMENSNYYFTRDLVSEASKGYVFSKEQYKELDPVRVALHPAGSILSTADDMAKFLIAHLEGERILKKETLNNMHQTHFTHYDKMLGNAYSFYEVMRGNNKVVEHGGNTPAFASLLSFYPQKKLGFFISCNSNKGGSQLREDFANEFYEYFLGKASTRKEIQNFQGKEIDIEDYVGEYTSVRITKESPLKILRPLMGRITVKKIDENSISVKYNNEENIYSKIQGKLFKNETDNSYLTFERDLKGRVYMIKEKDPLMGLVTGMHGTFEKTNKASVIIEDSKFIPLVISIIYLIIMFIGYFRKNKRKYVGNELRARNLMIIAALFILALSGTFGWLIVKVTKLSMDFNRILAITHILSFIFLGLTIITTIFTVISWRYRYWSFKGRVLHSIVNLSTISMLIFITYMNCFNIGY